MAYGLSLGKQIDQIYRDLGVWGKWQIGQVALLLGLQIPAAFQLLSIVFIGYQPVFRCVEPKTTKSLTTVAPTKLPYGTKCYISDNTTVSACPHDVEYNKHPGLETIVTEWDLVCGRSYEVQLSQTILIVGQAIGAVLFTLLADRYGRIRVCVLCQLGLMAVGIGTAFAPSIQVFTALRFPLGAFQQSLVMTSTVLPMEIIPMDQRTLVHLIFGLNWAVSQCILVGFSYAFKEESWRDLQLALCSASLFVAVLHYVFVDESLRWLLANERVTEVKKIMKQASRLNNINPPEKEIDDVASVSGSVITRISRHSSIPSISGDAGRSYSNFQISEGTSQTDVAQLKYSILDVLRNSQLRCTTVVLAFAWIVNALVYFGLSLTSAQLGGDRFLNFFLMVLVEFPAAIITYFTMKRPGRRMTCIIFHAMAGLAMIITASLNATQDKSLSSYVKAFSIIGKFAISSSWVCLFNYTTELYPTNARSIGLGLASSASRIGGMVAPFTNLVSDELRWLPGSIFGVSSLIVCGLMTFVPETRDKELPQKMEDIDYWDDDTTCCCIQPTSSSC